jgi:hypothetical protein
MFWKVLFFALFSFNVLIWAILMLGTKPVVSPVIHTRLLYLSSNQTELGHFVYNIRSLNPKNGDGEYMIIGKQWSFDRMQPFVFEHMKRGGGFVFNCSDIHTGFLFLDNFAVVNAGGECRLVYRITRDYKTKENVWNAYEFMFDLTGEHDPPSGTLISRALKINFEDNVWSLHKQKIFQFPPNDNGETKTQSQTVELEFDSLDHLLSYVGNNMFVYDPVQLDIHNLLELQSKLLPYTGIREKVIDDIESLSFFKLFY